MRYTLGSAAVVMLTLGLLSAGGCGPATLVVGVGTGDRALRATAVQRDGRWGSRAIWILDVSGTLVNGRQAGLLSAGENPVAKLTEALDAAAADDAVAAIILRINSPGGTVTASDIMYREVQRFRETTGKPVLALMMDVAASGGFYLACATDEGVAYPTTITGSIGVVLQTVSVKPALDRIGVDTDAIVSGPNKAAGSPFETLEPDQRAILQELVDGFYADFVEVVRARRPGIAESRWPMLTDGRVFRGERARELGLIDHTGDLRDAVARAKALADIEHADLYVVHRPLEYVASPYASAPRLPAAGGTQINLMQLNLNAAWPTTGAGAYYLWVPEVD